MRILLLGGTDLTLSLAKSLCEVAYPPAGVVFVGEYFRISYEESKVKNAKFADIEKWAQQSEIKSIEYSGLDSIASLQAEVNADIAIAAGWYHMISKRVRDLFPMGVYGIHHSYLPELRGGAPLNWAMLLGKRETGTSLFQFTDGVDEGPLIGQRKILIDPDAYIGDLVRNAEKAALELIKDVIPKLAAGVIKPEMQHGIPSYCMQRTPEDSQIKWTETAVNIARLVRASSEPYGGARSSWRGSEVFIWEARAVDNAPAVFGAPGQIFSLAAGRPAIITGDGLLELIRVTDENGSDCMPKLSGSSHQRLS